MRMDQSHQQDPVLVTVRETIESVSGSRLSDAGPSPGGIQDIVPPVDQPLIAPAKVSS